jgi:septal ring factor EnvC (AmiA/AmiB activator)
MDDEQVLRRELRVAADRIDNLTTERNMLAQRAAELEATAADLRRVNDALRARLADAEDVRRDEAEVERMRAEVADYARQLREAQKRTTWEVRDDGSRALVRCLIIHEQVGLAHLTDVGDQRGATYAYEVPGGVRGGGVHTDPNRDSEQALCAAQRIVETLTGVRP